MTSRVRTFGLGLAFVWLYLYSFPYFEQIHSANELPRAYLTMAMVDEGTFRIDTGVNRWGTTVDVSRARGHHYSNKAPGSSFLAIPAYLAVKGIHAITGGEPGLAELMWAFRVTTSTIPSLLFLWLLWRFMGRFVRSNDARRLAIVGYGLGSMAMTYAILFIAHQLSAVCIGSAYILLAIAIEDERDWRWLFAAGWLAGCAPLVDYQAAFAGVPLAVYAVWKLVGRPHRQWRKLAACVAGAAVPIALLLFYHHQAFGSPWKTGYDFSHTFAHFHQKGFLGMTALRWDAFAGSTIAPDNGLIVFSPMLLLALPGWYIMARRRLYWHLGITASVVVIYLLFISSINFWRGGWQMGPRYITAMLPFAMIPVVVAIEALSRRWVGRAVVVALVLVSVVVYAVSCAGFPHFPEKFANPLYEVTFRLIGDGLAPYNLGWAIGLRGLASLVPYLAVLICVLGWVALPHREHARSALAGVVCAALILASYGMFPDGGSRADRAYQWITTVMPR